jgi:hypothetical protein
MSGGVQTHLSPVLQESKTTPNKQHHQKKTYFNPKQQQLKSKSFNQNNVSSDNDVKLKKRQKLPNKFFLGNIFDFYFKKKNFISFFFKVVI